MSYQSASIKESIQATVSSFGRLVLAGSTAFGLASYANFGHHKSYWNGTIERVQTVDFNMLSHMLPTKLSQALIEGDQPEIQRTLDSNYGLFGLVVTDCRTSQPDCSQNIQYLSNSKLPWRQLLNDDTLRSSTYDVLIDPPPIYSTGSYADSRNPIRNPTGLVNTGRIIGRVYYVRGVPPSFLEAYSKWLRAWPASFLSDSGPNRYYSLTTGLFGLGGLSGWIFMEMGFSKRRKHAVQLNQQKEQLAISQAQLVEEAKGLRQQLREKLVENAELIESRSKTLAELAAAQQRYQSQEAKLRDSRQNLESRLTSQNQEYKAEKHRQTELKMAMQEQQRAVELLEKEIIDLRAQDIEGARNNQLTIEKEARLLKAQENKQKQVERYASELDQVWEELKLQTEAKEEKERLVALLSEQIEESERQQASASHQSTKLQDSLHLAEQERKSDKQRIKALEAELKKEKNQGNALRATVDGINQSALNIFEGKVVSALKKESKVQSSAWSIHTQLDLSDRQRKNASKFADCIVAGNSFIAVIEAKNYVGKIYADGDVQNSTWLCAEDSKDPVEVVSCWGDNPYKQVDNYVKGAMALVNQNISFRRKNICKNVSFYGIVVFPDNADISALDLNLEKYYRVTKLSDLPDVLHQLERLTLQSPLRKGEKRLSAAEIKDCLYGRHSAKPWLKPAA